MPALSRAVRASARPFTAAFSCSWPRLASTTEPTGSEATPCRGTKPASWKGTRSVVVNAVEALGGSFTNTSPETSETVVVRPATAGIVPDGSVSQASPILSPSLSAWSALAAAGQLSLASGTPSPSASGGGGGGGWTVHVRTAGEASTAPQRSFAATVNACAPVASPENANGLLHVVGAAPSSEHRNWFAGWLAWKENEPAPVVTVPEGPAVISVSGWGMGE